jgi:uncharacterized protein YjbJ (UPF0337 family)
VLSDCSPDGYRPRNCAIPLTQRVREARVLSSSRRCRAADFTPKVSRRTPYDKRDQEGSRSRSASHGPEQNRRSRHREIKGAAKTAVGKAVGDAKLQSDGKVDSAVGKIQNAVGGANDAIRDAAINNIEPARNVVGQEDLK